MNLSTGLNDHQIVRWSCLHPWSRSAHTILRDLLTPQFPNSSGASHVTLLHDPGIVCSSWDFSCEVDISHWWSSASFGKCLVAINFLNICFQLLSSPQGVLMDHTESSTRLTQWTPIKWNLSSSFTSLGSLPNPHHHLPMPLLNTCGTALTSFRNNTVTSEIISLMPATLTQIWALWNRLLPFAHHPSLVPDAQ